MLSCKCFYLLIYSVCWWSLFQHRSCQSPLLQAYSCQFIHIQNSIYCWHTWWLLPSNLECKASAHHYFQKLHQLTAPMAPASAPNFYQELLRVLWLWRWLKKKKWAVHSHMSAKPSQSSSTQSAYGSLQPLPILANFCPACCQPTINLPHDWEKDPNRYVDRLLYFICWCIGFTLDGCIITSLLPMAISRQIMLDKRLHHKTFGCLKVLACFPNTMNINPSWRLLWSIQWWVAGWCQWWWEVTAAQVIDKDTDVMQKTPCQTNFHAIELTMLGSKACDITGIVAIACTRHGCFVPNSISDLYKGEQQKMLIGCSSRPWRWAIWNHTKCYAHLQHCLPILCTCARTYWTSAAGLVTTWPSYQLISCSWTQRWMLLLCNIFHTWCSSDHWWDLRDSVVLFEFYHPHCVHGSACQPCGNNRWSCNRFQLQENGEYR